jgi:hypothetical protein
MMTDPVEKIARFIWRARNPNRTIEWDELSNESRASYLIEAKALVVEGNGKGRDPEPKEAGP